MGLGWGPSKIDVLDVEELNTGRLDTRRLIERHVFTEAQRSPFRSDQARVCQWAKQNGCALETKSSEICQAALKI